MSVDSRAAPIQTGTPLRLPILHASMAMRTIETIREEVLVEEPVVKRRIVAAIALVGAIESALGVAAEITRTKNYTYVMDYEQRFHCSYPGSPASIFGGLAIFLLIVSQGATTYYGGIHYLYTGPRYYLSRTLLIALFSFAAYWVCFFVAISTLFSGSVQNQLHSTDTSGGFTTLKCSLVSVGTFLSGTIFTLLTTGLQVGYYYAAIKARWDLWRTSGGYGGTPTAESELTAGR